MVRNDSFQQTGRDMLLVDVLCPRLRGSGSCLRYVCERCVARWKSLQQRICSSLQVEVRSTSGGVVVVDGLLCCGIQVDVVGVVVLKADT